jgi:signal transduction histidine kinase
MPVKLQLRMGVERGSISKGRSMRFKWFKLRLNGELINRLLWGGVVFNFVILLFFCYSLITSRIRVETMILQHHIKNMETIAEHIHHYLRHHCPLHFSLPNCLAEAPQLYPSLRELLKLLETPEYTHIALLTRVDFDKDSYKYLADPVKGIGTLYHPAPEEAPYWRQVYEKQAPVYFFRVTPNGEMLTYLYPIIHHQIVEGVVEVDCSAAIPAKIRESFQQFWFIGELAGGVELLLILFLAGALYLNGRLLQENRELMETLQEKNRLLAQRVAEEIKKKEQTEKQLLLQSRLAMMGELIRVIAHQWRQPLNSMAGVVTNIELMMLMGRLDDQKLKEELEELKEAIRHMDSIITDFQKFYHRKRELAEVSISSLIDEVLSFGSFTFRERGIKIIKKYECLPSVKTYPRELQQVVFNLLKNSEEILIARRVQNPMIEIRTSYEAPWCVITIRDNGGGIDEKIIDKIFDPYFTTKESKNGAGLGLYMAKMIVEKSLNGRLIVDNWEEGAEFKILLPLEKEPADE